MQLHERLTTACVQADQGVQCSPGYDLSECNTHRAWESQVKRPSAPIERNDQVVRDPKDDITLADVRRRDCCVNDIPRPTDRQRRDFRLVDPSLGQPCGKLRVIAA